MSHTLYQEGAPHDANVSSTGKIMRLVIYALVPAIIAHFYFFGWGIVFNLLFCLISSLVTEGIILKLRGHSLNRLWRDSSAALTAVILAIALPPLTPWYLTIIGCVFAIAIVKHAFGGLGHNIFNPAMGGFVFLLISAPLPMTEYIEAVPNNYLNVTAPRTISIIFNINKEQNLYNAYNDAYKHVITRDDADTFMANFDAITGATFLIDAKHEQPKNNVYSFIKVRMMDLSNYTFFAHLVISSLFLLGGIALIVFKVIDFRIPLSFLLTVIIIASICYEIAPNTYLPTLYHLTFGATFFGAFFILTDPVTAVPKPIGAVIFGIIAGIIFMLIRNFGGYPDAVAFSVLLTNACAPLISILTKRREFGAKSHPGDIYER